MTWHPLLGRTIGPDHARVVGVETTQQKDGPPRVRVLVRGRDGGPRWVEWKGQEHDARAKSG